jgi:hypothetical protein
VREREVEAIRIDEDGGLLVSPDLAADRDFAFIYRAARGVHWVGSARALSVPKPESTTYLERFGHIVEAVADEYGELLVVSEHTQFTRVPDNLQAEIRAWCAPRRLTRRCS